MCILDQIFGGDIGSFTVDWLVSALLRVSAGGQLEEVPVVLLNWDLLPAGWGVCGAMTCCCGKGKDDDNEKKWEVLRNI